MDLKAEVTEIGLKIVLKIFEVYAKYGLTTFTRFYEGPKFGSTKTHLLFCQEYETVVPSQFNTPAGTVLLDLPKDLSSDQIAAIWAELRTFITWQCVIPETVYSKTGLTRSAAHQLITHFHGLALPTISNQILAIKFTEPLKIETARDPVPNYGLFFEIPATIEEIKQDDRLYWSVVKKMIERAQSSILLTHYLSSHKLPT